MGNAIVWNNILYNMRASKYMRSETYKMLDINTENGPFYTHKFEENG